MNRMLKAAASGMVLSALLLMTAAGCRSTSPFSNPFSKQPSEGVKSPAEMDELQLKAPPENYTRGEMASKSADSAASLAQNGDYSSSQVPGFAAAAEPAPASQSAAGTANPQSSFPVAQNNLPASGSNGTLNSALNSPYPTEPVKTALNPAAAAVSPNVSPAASSAGGYGTAAGNSAGAVSGTGDNSIPAWPNTSSAANSVYPSAGTGTAGGISSNTGVFAPGSIGGY